MNSLLRTAGWLAAFGACSLAQAQSPDNYPTKPVMVVMPTGPGNVTDKESRIWTSKLGEALGQQLVLDYKTGAGSTLAARQVAQARPDGHTLGMVILNQALMRLRYQDLPFDPIKSFEYISLLNKRSGLIAVHPSLPINNIKEYIAYARGNPGVLNFLASGEGSNDHITGAWLMKETGTKVNFIHYKASSVGYIDFLAGRVHMMSIPYDAGGAYSSIVKAGKGRNIGTTTLQRSPMAPDVPTVHEQGIAGFEVSSFLGIYAPAKTPPAIVNRLHGELVKIARSADLIKQIGDGSIIVASTPEEFRRTVSDVEDRYRRLGQELNISYAPD